MSGYDRGRPRLAELIAALSLATDLGLGQPMEHVMRSCLISQRLGKRMGLSDAERAGLYYVALLAWVGCLADATEMSAWFGDDIALRADAAYIDDKPLQLFVVASAPRGIGCPAAEAGPPEGRTARHGREAGCRVDGHELPGHG